MLKTIHKQRKQYETWYAFKKDLEKYLWCHVDNTLWLKIKPKKALPWNESDMRMAIMDIFIN